MASTRQQKIQHEMKLPSEMESCPHPWVLSRLPSWCRSLCLTKVPPRRSRVLPPPVMKAKQPRHRPPCAHLVRYGPFHATAPPFNEDHFSPCSQLVIFSMHQHPLVPVSAHLLAFPRWALLCSFLDCLQPPSVLTLEPSSKRRIGTSPLR